MKSHQIRHTPLRGHDGTETGNFPQDPDSGVGKFLEPAPRVGKAAGGGDTVQDKE